MRGLVIFLLIAGVFGAALRAQQAKAPVAANPQVEFKGTISAVGIAPGRGMPSLDVKAEDGKKWKVWLGSMRYLMEQNFNPKAGQEAEVKGYKLPSGDEAVAITVTLPAAKQTLKLRDESGFPVWMRGPRGPRGRGPMGGRCCAQ